GARRRHRRALDDVDDELLARAHVLGGRIDLEGRLALGACRPRPGGDGRQREPDRNERGERDATGAAAPGRGGRAEAHSTPASPAGRRRPRTRDPTTHATSTPAPPKSAPTTNGRGAVEGAAAGGGGPRRR